MNGLAEIKLVSQSSKEVKPKPTAIIALALFVSTHIHLAHLHLAFVDYIIGAGARQFMVVEPLSVILKPPAFPSSSQSTYRDNDNGPLSVFLSQM